MTSEIRANTLKNRVGLGTISFTNTGAIVSGIVTANSFSGPIVGDVTGAASQITVADESSDTTCNPVFVTSTSGNLEPKTGTNLVFNSASGNLRTGSLFLGQTTNEPKTQDGLILERNSVDGEVHITAGRSGGNYNGFQFHIAGASGVTKRLQMSYDGLLRYYAADGSTERVRIASNGKVGVGVDPTNYPGIFVVSGDALICDRDIHSRVANSVANSDRGFKQDIDGTEKLHLYADNSSNIILEGNGGSERLRIDSSGRVMIGTTTAPNNANTDDFTLATSGHTGFTIRSGTSHDGQIAFSDGTNGADEYRGQVLYNHGSNFMRFVTNGTERLRIDSSGRVMIGNTDAGSLYGSGNNLVVGSGGASNQGITIYTGNAQQGILAFADGTSGGAQQYAGYMIYDHNTNDMLFATQATERFRINSDGGITVQQGNSHYPTTFIGGSTGARNYLTVRAGNTTSGHYSGFNIQNSSANHLWQFGVQHNTDDLDIFGNSAGGNLRFWTKKSGAGSSTIKMRLTHSGKFGINDDTAGWSEVLQVTGDDGGQYGIASKVTGTSGSLMRFATRNNSGNDQVCGSISGSGTSTSFNTSSDYRLKENDVKISNGISRVKQLRPIRFNWKSDSSKTEDGFFAHEVSPVVPESVSGEKDAEINEIGEGYQKIDHSKLVPLLTAALQEAITKIETLESKVATLEGS